MQTAVPFVWSHAEQTLAIGASRLSVICALANAGDTTRYRSAPCPDDPPRGNLFRAASERFHIKTLPR
jgi:hypothetical protein